MAKRSKAKSRDAGLPSGYTAIGGYAQAWDVKKNPTLEGVWGSVRKTKQAANKKGEKPRVVRVCDVTTDKGDAFAVWESAGLRPLFDSVKAGQRVFIQYLGLGKAKKGQSAPKLYRCGIAE